RGADRALRHGPLLVVLTPPPGWSRRAGRGVIHSEQRRTTPARLGASTVAPEDIHMAARHSSSPHADTRSIHARLTLQKVQCVADIQDLMLRNEPLATDSYPSSHLRESQPIICLHCIDSLQKAAAFAPSSVVNSHRYQSGRGKSGGNRL